MRQLPSDTEPRPQFCRILLPMHQEQGGREQRLPAGKTVLREGDRGHHLPGGHADVGYLPGAEKAKVLPDADPQGAYRRLCRGASKAGTAAGTVQAGEVQGLRGLQRRDAGKGRLPETAGGH